MHIRKFFFTVVFFGTAFLSFITLPDVIDAQLPGQSGWGNVSGQAGGSNNPGTIGGGNNSGTKILNPLRTGDSLYSFVEQVLRNVVIPIGAVIVVLFLIYAGFLFVTAQGNDTQLEKAKKNFLYVVIGAAILLGSWVLAKAIEVTVNQLTGVL